MDEKRGSGDFRVQPPPIPTMAGGNTGASAPPPTPAYTNPGYAPQQTYQPQTNYTYVGAPTTNVEEPTACGARVTQCGLLICVYELCLTLITTIIGFWFMTFFVWISMIVQWPLVLVFTVLCIIGLKSNKPQLVVPMRFLMILQAIWCGANLLGMILIYSLGTKCVTIGDVTVCVTTAYLVGTGLAFGLYWLFTIVICIYGYSVFTKVVNHMRSNMQQVPQVVYSAPVTQAQYT